MRQHFKVPHILNTNREYIQEYILLSFCRAVCRCPSSCNFESCVDVPNCSTSITWCLRSCIVWFIAVLTWCSATVYTVVRLMCPKLLLQRLVHQNLRCPIDTVCCSIKVSYTVPSRVRILFYQGFELPHAESVPLYLKQNMSCLDSGRKLSRTNPIYPPFN